MLIIILQIGTRLFRSSSLGLVTLISMGEIQDGCTMIMFYCITWPNGLFLILALLLFCLFVCCCCFFWGGSLFVVFILSVCVDIFSFCLHCWVYLSKFFTRKFQEKGIPTKNSNSFIPHTASFSELLAWCMIPSILESRLF